MHRPITLVVFSLVAMFSMGTAMAENPHFTSGPTSTQTGSTLTVCSTIAGLGNTATAITISCNATFQCQNKAGHVDNANQTLTTTTQYTPHNGTIKNACASVTASCPPGQAGPYNVQFGSCTYTVSQSGQTVLTATP